MILHFSWHKWFDLHAHELARVASYNATSHVYDNVPSCISSLIDNEKQWILPFKKKKLIWFDLQFTIINFKTVKFITNFEL